MLKIIFAVCFVFGLILAYEGGKHQQKISEKTHWEELYQQQTFVILENSKINLKKMEELYRTKLTAQWEIYTKALKHYADAQKKRDTICKSVYEENIKLANKQLLEKYK